MEEQSITIRYMVTRACLEEGIMRLLKYNEEYFPTDGVVTLTDEQGREYKAEVDRENMCVWNFGPLFDELNLGVNDVVLLHPVSNTEPYQQFWVSAEIDPSKSSINRSLQKNFSPQNRARHRIKKASLLPQVGELRSPPWGLPPELNPRLDLDGLDIEATLDGLPLFEALGDVEQVAPNWATHVWGESWSEAYGWSEKTKQARPLIEEEILVPAEDDAHNIQQRTPVFEPVFELEEDLEARIVSADDADGVDGTSGADGADVKTATDEQSERTPIFETEAESEMLRAQQAQEVLQVQAEQAETVEAVETVAEAQNTTDSGEREQVTQTADATNTADGSETEESNYLTELIDREMAREHAADPADLAADVVDGDESEESEESTIKTAITAATEPLPLRAVRTEQAEQEQPHDTQKASQVVHGVPDGWGDLEVAQQELQALSKPKEQPLEEPLDMYRDTSLRDELSYQPEGFGLSQSKVADPADVTDVADAANTVTESEPAEHEHLDHHVGEQPAQSTQSEAAPSERAQELKQATSSIKNNDQSGQFGKFGRSHDRERAPRSSSGGSGSQHTKSKRSFSSTSPSVANSVDLNQLGEQVKAFAELTGYRLEQLTPSLVRLNADLGPQFGYTVLLALDAKGCDHAAWKHPAEDYLAMLVTENERPSRVCRLTREALQALTEHARLAPLSPVDLHGYWRSGSLDLDSSVNIAALANAYLTQRGTFSYVLLTLAGQQANSVITISRLAVRLGNNINAEDLRVILDTLSKPPFLALTPLPNGQYILRRTMPTMLEELADYAQTMQNRLQQAESEQ